MKIIRQQLEHLTLPLGVDRPNPVFSWNIETPEPGWRQKAYRILVAGSREGLDAAPAHWDSGRVESRRMTDIPYKGGVLESDTRYWWRVQVWGESDPDGAPAVSDAWFGTGLMNPADWQGVWIGETEDRMSHLYRHSFRLEKRVARASLFVCGLGHYELSLNGERVGDRVLEPGWTAYDKTCLYSGYDVTGMLRAGENAVGVQLGDGMFNVVGGRYCYYPRSFGKMKLLAQLNVTYADGSRASVVSGPDWRMAPSPRGFCCIYGGEDYDARLERDGFDAPGFTGEESWRPVRVVEPPKGRLVSQLAPPVKVMESYEPVSVREVKPGAYLYDFGTNFSGWPRVELTCGGAPSGRVVTMTPGEILGGDGLPDQRVTGEDYHWQYTMNEKCIQIYEPKFTYTGFRYLLVEGAVPAELAGDSEGGPIVRSIRGQFLYPDMEAAGAFSCSNGLFNDIHRIVRQAMLSNIKSYTTDCPHREKLPWVEQNHLIGPAMLCNFDLWGLYQKIEGDAADAQHDDGLVPDICPQYVVFGFHSGFNDSPEWGSAAILGPWYIYKRYGDLSLFERYYGVMKRYVDYLTLKTHHHTLHHGLGDWLDIGPCPPSQNTPVPVVATAIYYYDLSVMAEIAGLLGKEEDSKVFAALGAEVRREFRLQYFDDQLVRVANGSQAAQAMALVCGLVDGGETEKVLGHLVRDIERRGWATTAGDVGHPFVLAALTKYGRSDVIGRMTMITDKPGYGYQVVNGATTLTENWDGPNPARPINSQNHLMLGSIDEWFYAGLAGLGSLRADLPFDRVLIRPSFIEECDEATAWTLHPHGRVSIHWKKTPEGVLVTLTIPPNLEALFVPPHGGERLLASGTHELVV